VSICPLADDIWLKAMSMPNGTQCYKVQNHNPCLFFSPNNQDIALWIENRVKSKNDEQLQAVFSQYHLFEQLKP